MEKTDYKINYTIEQYEADLKARLEKLNIKSVELRNEQAEGAGKLTDESILISREITYLNIEMNTINEALKDLKTSYPQKIINIQEEMEALFKLKNDLSNEAFLKYREIILNGNSNIIKYAFEDKRLKISQSILDLIELCREKAKRDEKEGKLKDFFAYHGYLIKLLDIHKDLLSIKDLISLNDD